GKGRSGVVSVFQQSGTEQDDAEGRQHRKRQKGTQRQPHVKQDLPPAAGGFIGRLTHGPAAAGWSLSPGRRHRRSAPSAGRPYPNRRPADFPPGGQTGGRGLSSTNCRILL